MAKAVPYLYTLVLSLWVGGIAVFTFLVTPVLFKSFTRDRAGEIVEKLFPAYFFSLLALSIAALILFLIFAGMKPTLAHRASLILIIAAIGMNIFVTFKLQPDIKKVKQEIGSFEGISSEASERKEFRRLHAVSATLNLLLLADGVLLLFFRDRLQ